MIEGKIIENKSAVEFKARQCHNAKKELWPSIGTNILFRSRSWKAPVFDSCPRTLEPFCPQASKIGLLLNSTDKLMQKIAKIGFIAWCLWLVVRSLSFVANSPAGGSSLIVWISNFVGIPVIVGCCVLVRIQAKRASKGLAAVLVVLILFLLWKYYVGEIVFAMHPQMGGYSFRESVAASLSRNTATIGRALLWFPPLMLLVASLIFYPIYSIVHERDV